MFRSAQLGAFWKILSQVNVEEIRGEVERPFRLLVAGEPADLADRLACLLSHESGGFAHPWLTVTAAGDVGALEKTGGADLAVLVSQNDAAFSQVEALHRRLLQSQTPALHVIVGDAGGAPALAPRGMGRHLHVPALTPAAVEKTIGPVLVDVAPDWLRLALGRRLPPLRPAVYNWLIKETSQANGAYAFSTGLAETIPLLDIPLNVGDLFVLTKNQLIMAYQIALVAGKEGSPRKLLGEIVSVLGGGFLFRQLARQLVGIVPVWGLAPKVAIAYAGTWTIGHAVVLWAEEGQRVTPALLKQFYAEALERGQRAAQEIVGALGQRLSLDNKTQQDASSTEPKAAKPWSRLLRRLR